MIRSFICLGCERRLRLHHIAAIVRGKGFRCSRCTTSNAENLPPGDGISNQGHHDI
jgi:hypothetical protein